MAKKKKKTLQGFPPLSNARSLISLHDNACLSKDGLIGTARHMVAATTPRPVSGALDQIE